MPGEHDYKEVALHINDVHETLETAKPNAIEKKDEETNAISPSQPSLCFLYRLNRFVRRLLSHNWRLVKTGLLLLLFLGYMAYFGYCMYYKFGGEPSIRLLVGTIIGLLVVGNYLVRRVIKCPCGSLLNSQRGFKVKRILRWLLYAYAVCVGGAIAILVDVGMKRPQNMICLLGLALLILFSFFMASEPEKINWHAVFWGIGLQFWFAVFIRRTSFGSDAFEWLADRFVEFLKYSDKGSVAVFGKSYLDHRFIFQVSDAWPE